MADKKKPGKSSAGSSEPVAVPIELYCPENIIGRYANHVVVQMGVSECSLLFFEFRPPLIVGSSEEVQEQAKSITSIRAECVSRLIVPNALLPAIVAAISNVVEKRIPQTHAESPDTKGTAKGA